MALEDYRAMMERCSNCSGCKWIPFDKIKSQRYSENCPSISYYNFNTHSARGRFQLAQTLLDGDCEFSPDVVEAIHNCTACGSCDSTCKITRYNLEPLDHNLALKAKAVAEGYVLPEQKPIMDSLQQEKTMLPGELRSNRLHWASGIEVKDLMKEKGEVAFYPGCKYSYNEKLKPVAANALKLLINAGADVGIFGSADMCCAGRALQMGFENDYEQQAKANMEVFAKSGVSVIVTPCSDCYHAFKRQYTKMGLDIKVMHLVEYLDELIQDEKLVMKNRVPMTVTYHDPCHLGRLGEAYVPWEGKEKKILNQVHTWEPRRPRYNGADGIYDAPRRILQSIPGVELVEMERIREYTWCCGAGGGCSQTNPEFASWTANERITEANATGAEAMVTACPWCEESFMNAKDEDGNTIQVVHLIDLVLQAI